MKKIITTFLVFTIIQLLMGCAFISPRIESITFDEEEISIELGDVYVVPYSVEPSLSDDRLTWTSSNTEVLICSENWIYPLQVGQAILTVTSKSGVSASITVNVIHILVEEVYYQRLKTGLNVGQIYQLVPRVYPPNADNYTMTYRSSNPNVVTVDDSGLLLAMNPGVSTITTMTDNGVSTSYLLHVYYQYQAYLQEEIEENESFSTANIITQNGTTLNGSLRSNQDIDIYKVYLFKGDSISVFLSPEDVEHVPFYFVGFVDQDQQLLSMSLELNTYHILTSSVPANGYYYLFVMALPNAPFEEPSTYESFIYWE